MACLPPEAPEPAPDIPLPIVVIFMPVATPSGRRYSPGRVQSGHLAADGDRRHALRVEEQGVYREEVYGIMFALADLKTDVRTILRYIEDEDDGEEEEEEEEEDLPDC
jgi:hypothetical protein